uniref:RNase H type-1 domain-containing protein n=1 Tax=Sinocyclocheilus anshuiensis TaxID=1608454 RepID=A0A671PMT5_9TELE
MSPASHLPQQPTDQGWRGNQRTHSYLANDAARTGRRSKICPKPQIISRKRASSLPELFNGHAAHSSRTQRTVTATTDKPQVLRGERPHSSQYAETAAILITLQFAASHNIKELLICTDSNYARLSFTCHLAGWKQNGFKTANNKPVKHQELFQACEAIVTEHDMIVYWKKVRGHSRQRHDRLLEKGPRSLTSTRTRQRSQ